MRISVFLSTIFCAMLMACTVPGPISCEMPRVYAAPMYGNPSTTVGDVTNEFGGYTLLTFWRVGCKWCVAQLLEWNQHYTDLLVMDVLPIEVLVGPYVAADIGAMWQLDHLTLLVAIGNEEDIGIAFTPMTVLLDRRVCNIGQWIGWISFEAVRETLPKEASW